VATAVITADEVAERAAAVRERIAAAGRSPDDVVVVAVTKGFGPEAVEAAAAAGLSDVGENYAQELAAKWDAVGGGGCRWHFLGRVQRNKVRRIAPAVHLWQGVDRVEAAREIGARSPGAPVLVQVDVAGTGRNGCAPDEVAALVERIGGLDVDVRGLMAVGPPGPPELARLGFRKVAALAASLGLAERSMGMSDDLEVAVEEGSTMVRIGRALFGSRAVAGRLRR
jgi:pyridoxal phosphate enzyme (YggS family)